MPRSARQHTIQLRSDSVEQTMQIARDLAGSLRPGDVIALEGPLGSGKTCFVRGLAQGLGLNPASVSSPTFVICQEYERPSGGGPPLVHIDAYRLSGPNELDTIGWNEMLEARDAVIAVEWPSRIAAALPPEDQRIDVTFEHIGEHSRAITVSGPKEKLSRLQPGSADKATCRTCGKSIDSSISTFPFCSDRCRLADLGKWFNEGYRTTRAVEADEELDE